MESATTIAGYSELESNLRALARELVQNIHDAPTTLAKYGVDQAEYDKLAGSAMFQGMLREAQKEWEAASNTKDRVRLKAALAYEQAIPDLFAQISNEKEPLSSRVSVATLFAKTAGLLSQEILPGKAAEGFRLEINFGAAAPTKNIVIEHPAVTAESNPDEDEDWERPSEKAALAVEDDPFDEAFAEEYVAAFKARELAA